ncbi:hypothetical protein ACIQU5_27915 [Streptomyces sp. NPDC090306]|uniref:hypothetical protein n=1 Tax=Streptomyces sp. NPDC090306 TaxID=3365961 RepID=UPI00381ADA95
MSARPEAVAAAAWWASRLAAGAHTHDVGDRAASDRVSQVAALVVRQRGQAQIERFRDALADLVEEHLARRVWRPQEPKLGSGLRVIAIDYVPHPVLTAAAEQAGFQLGGLDLPLKTTMWINPGEIRIAEGYRAQITTVWRADR